MYGSGQGSPSRGEVLRHMQETAWSESDIHLAISSLDRRLESRRVKVKSGPLYDPALGINEEDLQSVLQEVVGYPNEIPLLHDLRCLTALYRLRKGRVEIDLEKCRAIFITNNRPLVWSSRRFFNHDQQLHV